MGLEWTFTSTSMPSDGMEVEFLPEHRSLPMSGIYRQGVFVSRWSQYEAACVREWREAEHDGAAPRADLAFPDRGFAGVTAKAETRSRRNSA